MSCNFNEKLNKLAWENEKIRAELTEALAEAQSARNLQDISEQALVAMAQSHEFREGALRAKLAACTVPLQVLATQIKAGGYYREMTLHLQRVIVALAERAAAVLAAHGKLATMPPAVCMECGDDRNQPSKWCDHGKQDGHGSGPLPGRDVTAVQEEGKTKFVQMPEPVERNCENICGA